MMIAVFVRMWFICQSFKFGLFVSFTDVIGHTIWIRICIRVFFIVAIFN